MKQNLCDPTCYYVNTRAVGDTIAAVPVVNYVIQNFHIPNKIPYRVQAPKSLRVFYDFVPDENFLDVDDKLEGRWATCQLNAPAHSSITRLTPMHVSLSHYSSLKFMDRILPLTECNYLPLQKVDVSKFNLDFTRAVIICSTYRDTIRYWPVEEMIKVAEYVKASGHLPIFIGKEDFSKDTKTQLTKEDAGRYGIDLRNQTSLLELATLMGMAKAVVGLDSGPIHLAGTTSVPIICGYTSVAPEYRIPVRRVGPTYVVAPDVSCKYCQSHWLLYYWDFGKCYLKHADCCKQMTADKFIGYLSRLLCRYKVNNSPSR